MKVLHVLASNIFAGAERVAVNIIKNMTDYECLYVSPQGSIQQSLMENGVNYFPLKKLTIWDLQKVINQHQPDIIHAHDYRASIISAYCSKNGKVISHLHNNVPWAKRINAKSCLYNFSISRYDKIITVSAAIRDEFIWQESISPRAIVIPNVIDAQEVLDASSKPIVSTSDLLFMGRLTKQKSPLDFISVVAEIKKQNPNISAIILGEGELQNKCQELVNELKLQANISMLGFQSNPFPYIAATKVVLMPSKWEGFGLVAMEAMVLGKPVVAYNVGGLPDVVLDGQTGYLCNSLDEMVNKANILLHNEALLLTIGQQARKWALQKNNMEDYISSIKNIYIDGI